ncbi:MULTISPECIES: hypothetical protein [unclassified Idiomarina]|mgnify:FL=1|jgi:hypothetical protein|uniref:hypothetical protein n=1 Tax=unclassified Idiomarina TaxID=2614829 RepID=UPI000AD9F70B|nr:MULTISPECIES: hypothetical protein [unclassified Idiomarina]MCH2455834.1 hypothetical protein [Idiomarina sp.]MCJ8316155.1 hypothetical protein [Idiomarina sp.]WPZ00187.1 hypothetical protein UM402_06665 [Idiomarina sp. OXR-189]|tara:strand:- start:322 stop:618 length:297 start_codon:yes stop_codon:yes gene_type:complete
MLMFAEFDIHSYLVTREDAIFFEDYAEEASDQINEMLHHINALRTEDDTTEQLEEMVRRTLFDWIEEPALLELSFDEMDEYVQNLMDDVREQEEEQNE